MSEAFLILLLVVIPAFDLAVAATLWWAVRRTPDAPRTLVERAWLATAIWIGVSIVASLGLARMVGGVSVDETVRGVLLTIGILLPSAVNLLWLVRFVTGGFGKEDDDDQ